MGREIDVRGMKKYVNVENFYVHHILTNYQPTKDKSLEKIEKEEVQIFEGVLALWSMWKDKLCNCTLCRV